MNFLNSNLVPDGFGYDIDHGLGWISISGCRIRIYGFGFSITLRLGWIMDLTYFSDSDLVLDSVLASGRVGLWIQYIYQIWIWVRIGN